MTNKFNTQLLADIKNRYAKVSQDAEYFYFYKFMSFDPQLMVLNTFINSELKYTNPIHFNDPYDSHFHVNIDFNDFNKKNVELAFGKISPSKWISGKKTMMKHIENDFSTNFTEDYRKRFSVTCFTSDPFSILMWSHYAYNHTGFIMEFKIPKFNIDHAIFNGTLAPLPVFYEDEYPQIHLNWNILKAISSHGTQTELLKKMILTKAKCWEYENEFRLLSETQPCTNKNIILNSFNPANLSSVILGAKIDIKTHSKKINQTIDLFNLKNESNVQIYNAELIKSRYELNVPGHPRLDKK